MRSVEVACVFISPLLNWQLLLDAFPTPEEDDVTDEAVAWQRRTEDDTPPEQDHAIMAHTPSTPPVAVGGSRPLSPTDFTLDSGDGVVNESYHHDDADLGTTYFSRSRCFVFCSCFVLLRNNVPALISSQSLCLCN